MSHPQTAKNGLYDAAKTYVDKQLDGMKKNGLKTEKVSSTTYKAMIEQVMKAVQA